MVAPTITKMFDNCLTSSVKFKAVSTFNPKFMLKEQTATIREFLRNYKKLSSSNKIIIVSERGKPKGVYIPYEEWHKEKVKKPRKFKIADLEKYCFTGGDPDLSQKIDEICYPYPNKLKNDSN